MCLLNVLLEIQLTLKSLYLNFIGYLCCSSVDHKTN